MSSLKYAVLGLCSTAAAVTSAMAQTAPAPTIGSFISINGGVQTGTISNSLIDGTIGADFGFGVNNDVSSNRLFASNNVTLKVAPFNYGAITQITGGAVLNSGDIFTGAAVQSDLSGTLIGIRNVGQSSGSVIQNKAVLNGGNAHFDILALTDIDSSTLNAGGVSTDAVLASGETGSAQGINNTQDENNLFHSGTTVLDGNATTAVGAGIELNDATLLKSNLNADLVDHSYITGAAIGQSNVVQTNNLVDQERFVDNSSAANLKTGPGPSPLSTNAGYKVTSPSPANLAAAQQASVRPANNGYAFAYTGPKQDLTLHY